MVKSLFSESAIAYGGRLRHRKAQKRFQSLYLAWNSRQAYSLISFDQ
ncbi:hypothetical protein H6G36_28810 [Anabaena minutissima FACHB-250]|nr:hypothetical protein [Anabaena minutissima FACHB-250]